MMIYRKIIIVISVLLAMITSTAYATDMTVKFPGQSYWEHSTDRHLEVPLIIKVKNPFWIEYSRVELKCRFDVELSNYGHHTEVIEGNPKVVDSTIMILHTLHIDNYDREYITRIGHECTIGSITLPE